MTLIEDLEMKKKIIQGIINLIETKKIIVQIFRDKDFVKYHISEKCYGRMSQAKFAIDDFLEDFASKLGCSVNELENIVIKSINVNNSYDELEKLIDFMNKRKIIWENVCVGLFTAIASFFLFLHKPDTILIAAIKALGSGLTAAGLNLLRKRIYDNLDCFLSRTRFDEITRAWNLYNQCKKYGKNPTMAKFKIKWKEWAKSWEWEPI